MRDRELALPTWSTAPETHVHSARPSSHATDIWMFGLALWELLGVNGGERPFAQLDNPVRINARMTDAAHVPVPLNWTGVGEEAGEFRKLVEDCCSYEPEQRPTIDLVVDRLAYLERKESDAFIGKVYLFFVYVFFFSIGNKTSQSPAFGRDIWMETKASVLCVLCVCAKKKEEWHLIVSFVRQSHGRVSNALPKTRCNYARIQNLTCERVFCIIFFFTCLLVCLFVLER